MPRNISGVAERFFVRLYESQSQPDHAEIDLIAWEIEVGFIDNWRPLYPCILGNVGFLDHFTVTVSRFAQATAVERRMAFDDRFATGH